MNLKTNQKILDNSVQTVRLDDIIDENDWQELVKEKNNSGDVSIDSDFFRVFLSEKDEKDKQDFWRKRFNYGLIFGHNQNKQQQNRLAQKQMVRYKGLLSNQIFSRNYQSDDIKPLQPQNSSQAYLSQYRQWKQISDDNHGKTHKIQNRKEQLLSKFEIDKQKKKADECKVKDDELDGRIKNIHEEYLQQVRRIVQKSDEKQQRKQSKIQSASNHQEQVKTQQNQFQSNKQQKAISIDNQQLQSSENDNNPRPKLKITDEDINEYCFQNMIKNKPNFITKPSKNFSKKNNVSEPEKHDNQASDDDQSQLSESQKKLREQYLYGRQTNKIKHVDGSSRSSNTTQQGEVSKYANKTRESYKNMIPTKDYSQATNGEISYMKASNLSQTYTNQKVKQPATTPKLNISKLLSLPPQQFLIFYDQNYRKILSMTTPQQFSQLRQYQEKCIQKAEAVQKLRQKFSSPQGTKMIQKLSTQQKEKLFQLLYHEYEGL